MPRLTPAPRESWNQFYRGADGRWTYRKTKFTRSNTGICEVRFCSNEKQGRRSICHRCHSRLNRLNNPLTYAYQMLKGSAAKRGIAFSLTKEEFRAFCDESGYLETRGKRSRDMTVDRIDSIRGYEAGNIQTLTQRENIQKQRQLEKEDPDQTNFPF